MSEKTGPGGLAFWKWLLGPWMLGSTFLAYLWAQPLKNGFQVPEAARIIFWHVPMAMLGLFWFWVGAVYGLRFLYGRDQGSGSMDRRVQFANEIGLVCTLLATLSGMVFATVQWGTPWSWDPKQTSILVLIVIYVSYFGLRMSVENPDLRGRLSAVYAVIGAVMTPLLMYVVPHLPIFPGLHPTEVISQGLDTKWRLIYWSFTLGFLGVTIWLFQLKLRIASLSEWLEQRVAEPAVEFATRAVRNPARGVMANRAGGAPEGGVQ